MVRDFFTAFSTFYMINAYKLLKTAKCQKNLYNSLKYIKLDIFCMSIFKKFTKRLKIKKNTIFRDIIFITENANKNNQWKNMIFISPKIKKINKYCF